MSWWGLWWGPPAPTFWDHWLEYPHLAARVTEQRIADQKRTIMLRHLLSEVEIETIRMLVNHPTPGAIEHLENVTNEETVEPVIEDVGVGEKRGRGHAAFREVVYTHPLRLPRRADAFPEENITVSEKLQRLQKNFNQALQEFREVEPCSRHSFPKLKFSKDLLALVGYLNSKILPLYLDTELTVLQV